ncbi:hypothetical protein F4778DRAFT_395290 [Xylariomycetidae sp. FL2044]|nr:hypothetical protein F4778DRAFT_395290 [Xylariomycetidae sp. FL2044]
MKKLLGFSDSSKKDSKKRHRSSSSSHGSESSNDRHRHRPKKHHSHNSSKEPEGKSPGNRHRSSPLASGPETGTGTKYSQTPIQHGQGPLQDDTHDAYSGSHLTASSPSAMGQGIQFDPGFNYLEANYPPAPPMPPDTPVPRYNTAAGDPNNPNRTPGYKSPEWYQDTVYPPFGLPYDMAFPDFGIPLSPPAPPSWYHETPSSPAQQSQGSPGHRRSASILTSASPQASHIPPSVRSPRRERESSYVSDSRTPPRSRNPVDYTQPAEGREEPSASRR